MLAHIHKWYVHIQMHVAFKFFSNLEVMIFAIEGQKVLTNWRSLEEKLKEKKGGLGAKKDKHGE